MHQSGDVPTSLYLVSYMWYKREVSTKRKQPVEMKAEDGGGGEAKRVHGKKAKFAASSLQEEMFSHYLTGQEFQPRRNQTRSKRLNT